MRKVLRNGFTIKKYVILDLVFITLRLVQQIINVNTLILIAKIFKFP